MIDASVRTRGSMDVPSSVRMVNEDYWWGSTHWQRSFPEPDYDCFTDIYQHYGTGVWPYKPCTHVKSRCQYGFTRTPDIQGYTCAQTGQFFSYRPYHGRQVMNYFWDNPFSSIDTSGAICPEKLINRVWGRIEGRLPDLKGDAPDFTVFISELGELRETFDFLLEKTRARMLAGAHLSWSFGVVPFIYDIERIFYTLVQWHKRLNGLLQGVGKVHDLAANVVYLEPTRNSFIGRCPHGGVADSQSRACGYFESTQVTHRVGITVKYVYHFPDFLFKWEADVYNFLRVTGLIPDSTTVWEKIPFSFVVDWVFNTDRLFKSLGLNERGHGLKVKIIDVCLTEKLRKHETAAFRRLCLDDFNAPAKRQVEIFRRTTGDKALSIINGSDWWFRPPSFTAVLLGLSLSELLGLRPRIRSVKTHNKKPRKHK